MRLGSVSGWPRSWTALVAALSLPLAAAACDGDDAAEPIVGSGKVVERVMDVMFVEEARISMPFRAFVYNGEPKQVVVRGEDNLIDRIEITEDTVGRFSIRAPDGLAFEQHEDVEIEIPYIDMVLLALDGEVEVGDHPSGMWRADGGG